jgi:hypothetical protein
MIFADAAAADYTGAHFVRHKSSYFLFCFAKKFDLGVCQYPVESIQREGCEHNLGVGLVTMLKFPLSFCADLAIIWLRKTDPAPRARACSALLVL